MSKTYLQDGTYYETDVLGNIKNQVVSAGGTVWVKGKDKDKAKKEK